MENLQKEAFTYKAYQKNFKVEVTKYDALEEAHAELKLKELLWTAIDDWDNLLEEWMSVSLNIVGDEVKNMRREGGIISLLECCKNLDIQYFFKKDCL